MHLGRCGAEQRHQGEQNLDHRCVSLGTRVTSWEVLRSPYVCICVWTPQAGTASVTFSTPLFTVEGFDPQEAVRCLAVFSQLELASPEIPHAWRETWSAVGGQVETHGEMSCEGREQGRPGSRTLLWVKGIQPMICEVLGAAFWKPETSKGLFVPAGQRPVPSLRQPGPPLHLFVP